MRKGLSSQALQVDSSLGPEEQQTLGWAQPLGQEIAPLVPLAVVPEASAVAFATVTGCCVSPVSPSESTCPLQAALRPMTMSAESGPRKFVRVIGSSPW